MSFSFVKFMLVCVCVCVCVLAYMYSIDDSTQSDKLVLNLTSLEVG